MLRPSARLTSVKYIERLHLLDKPVVALFHDRRVFFALWELVQIAVCQTPKVLGERAALVHALYLGGERGIQIAHSREIKVLLKYFTRLFAVRPIPSDDRAHTLAVRLVLLRDALLQALFDLLTLQRL